MSLPSPPTAIEEVELNHLPAQLTPTQSIAQEKEADQPDEALPDPGGIDKRGLWSLGAQHLSSAWGERTAEFAFYLYLIELFQTTLLPASLFGFFTTGAGIIFSGLIGSLVDRVPRLSFVRWCILVQKLSATSAYTCFLLLFATRLKEQASKDLGAPALIWVLFALIVLAGCVLKLSTIGISVAIERDWATTIAEGNNDRLTTLNTILRRIDLLCKLLAPLFVSLLTTTASYSFSVAFFLAFGLVTMVFEFVWIQVVYRRLPSLATEEEQKRKERLVIRNSQVERPLPTDSRKRRLPTPSSVHKSIQTFLKNQATDWLEFVKHPIFGSSLSISCLYLTVLSFDGTMLSWLKTHNFSDPFIAGMRGICVVAGLLGTFVAPAMEKRLGLIRAGHWAIWSEVISLLPVLLSFYVGAPKDGIRSSGWNAALLFAGMALSRIGLWAFDLCQLKELQTALADHPRRNAITALQFAMQNIADLMKYVLTMILSRPSQFRWAALVSFISVCAGALSYLLFLKRMRGHVIHAEWIESLLGKGKVG
ncbi:hypothetical protein JAAARDRAFT_197661 [Jaapia argillacea MUCL 33604]|uniref:Solute carrier family 40 member n=1 Tax=Jaapia argillacea MUCL 33604 TaxID=933084 RepID=A0A067PPF3_9AGAM|nr:hypothetical protein JAAARDRAFT_197661 [Jaapia argillacea MUCL 33604]